MVKRARPFLTIVTRCCRRPGMITRNIESVTGQSCQDYEQLFLVDHTGAHKEDPIIWANGQFSRYESLVDGQYVYMLDDDGFLDNDGFIHAVRSHVVKSRRPEVVLVRSVCKDRKGSNILTWPSDKMFSLDWDRGQRPVKWKGNGYCVVTRVDVWKKRLSYYTQRAPGGDWYFIQRGLIDNGHRFSKLNVVGGRSIQRGYGVMFEKCKSNWWETVLNKFPDIERKGSQWIILGHKK